VESAFLKELRALQDFGEEAKEFIKLSLIRYEEELIRPEMPPFVQNHPGMRALLEQRYEEMLASRVPIQALMLPTDRVNIVEYTKAALLEEGIDLEAFHQQVI
jgi:hypothetical protein